MSGARRLGLFSILSLAVLLAACSSAAPVEPTAAPAAASATPPAGPPQRGLAVVQSLVVAAPAAGAGQAQAVIRGELGDACTQLAEVTTQRNGQVFVVTLNTSRPAGAACAAVVSDFSQTVTLDLAGLPAGEYVVVANGVSGNLSVAGAAAPSPTASLEAPAPTAAPTEAAQANPTLAAPTPAPTTAPAAAAQTNCLDKAAFDKDVTIPDRSVLTPGQKFVKTWRVQNAGTCVWQGYQLIFDNGDRMGATLSQAVPAVKPGEYVELSVDMAAPAEGGSHIGRWQFLTPAGKRFGLSVPNDGLLWVWIDVPYAGGAAAAPASAPAASGGSSASNCGAARNGAGEAQILAQINSARAQNGLPALNLNAQLNDAAWRHAQDMACNGINSLNPHRGSDGTLWKDRVSQSGYGGNAKNARENVYYGGTPADAFDWWMNSQVHRDNILFPTATDIGVAYAVVNGSEWTNYYTLVFGQP